MNYHQPALMKNDDFDRMKLFITSPNFELKMVLIQELGGMGQKLLILLGSAINQLH